MKATFFSFIENWKIQAEMKILQEDFHMRKESFFGQDIWESLNEV